MSKLNNPARLAELNMKETLNKIGLQENDVFCDFGAGTGIFTFVAAQKKGVSVYAIEISEDKLNLLEDEKIKNNLENITIYNDINMIDNNSLDVLLMCTVLHEVADQKVLLHDINSKIKKGGLFSIIEFHKKETPFGPPLKHRIEKDKILAIGKELGLTIKDEFDLGDNFYCLVFKKI